MMYYIKFQPPSRPAVDTSLYTLVYKCIHYGIIYLAKTESK